ncbi:MAG: FAD-binding oxidoreductase [Dictyoglomaceae bacterium]|nr:FAD-binding oxidoreductase [Dictyoglomaceae bacterium]
MFRKVNEMIIDELINICGENDVLTNHEDLERYSQDESGKFYAHLPEIVVRPESSGEVSKVLKLANENLIPITPRGAGSGLAGGAIPLYGGLVLSFEKMNQILEIDKGNLTATCEPGVVTNDLCKKVAEEELFYPGYPMSVETSFLGGNVATNAGGSKVIKYGNTGHHVLFLEVVLPSGEIINIGGKRRKDSSGYNLLNLFIGSEGTLGVFTKIIVNLIPLPPYTVDLLVPFPNVESAIYTVPKIISGSKVLPCAIEFIDQGSYHLSSIYTKERWEYDDKASSYLIIQFDGNNKNQLEEAYIRAGEACLKEGALEVFVAENPFASEKLWRIRRNYLEAIKAVDPYVVLGDAVVPTSSIPEMLRKVRKIGEKYKVEIYNVAHAGDGNIHSAPLKPKDLSPEEWQPLQERILDEISIIAQELGGAISGEHGIGFVKKKALYHSKKKEILIMKELKKVFDPNGIMNPGKIF